MESSPTDTGIHLLFRVLMWRLACALGETGETRFSGRVPGVKQVGSESLGNRSVTPVHQDCRRAERASFTEYCPYEITEPLGDDTIAIHEGEALSVNISRGGMLLLMDQSPPVRQVFEILVPASSMGKTPGVVEVCWTRQLPMEDSESRHLVGVKFLFDPSADSHERVVEHSV
jgi:PilZ domain-containing protein